MRRIRVSRLAEQDLDAIWYRIANESGSIETANGLLESITGKFILFSRTPEAGTRRDDIDPGVRGFPFGKYLSYYREVGD